MTADEIKEAVMRLIDDESRNLDNIEYQEFLRDLIGDLKIRLEASEEDDL